MTNASLEEVANRDEPAGPEYLALLDALLKDQNDRKASIEQRGLAVITTCGSLATLLFGLVALVTGAENFSLPRQANGPLGMALVGFTAAALVALATNAPLFYVNIKMKKARDQIWKHWDKGKGDALQRIAGMRMNVIVRAQLVNSFKAWLLALAMLLEVIAVVAVAIAVGEVLRHT
jgi:hypothetical protein